jgi:hypothetical protein
MPLERKNDDGEDARRISRVAVGADRLARIVLATLIVEQHWRRGHTAHAVWNVALCGMRYAHNSFCLW